jgi:hypothetical protein
MHKKVNSNEKMCACFIDRNNNLQEFKIWLKSKNYLLLSNIHRLIINKEFLQKQTFKCLKCSNEFEQTPKKIITQKLSAAKNRILKKNYRIL